MAEDEHDSSSSPKLRESAIQNKSEKLQADSQILSTSEGSQDNGSSAERLTDSPWFWAYIFSTAGLIALALASPKYHTRQAQLERQFLARQEGGQTIKGDDGQSIAPPTRENLILRLGPLFLICGALLVVAWSRFWWSRFAPETGASGGLDEGSGDSRPR